MDPTTNLIFFKPYSIAQTQMRAFLKELNHLIDKGVLEHIPCSEWTFPTFITPKKDGRICWSLGSYTDHLSQIHQVLLRLKRNRFTVNLLECGWAAQTTEYLGFLLAPEGIKHLPNKVQAITRIARPISTRQVRSFVILVSYYKDMWPRRAHILTPLTDICSIRKIHLDRCSRAHISQD